MEISFQQFSKEIKSIIKPNKNPYIIGITGGSGSGKSYIAELIASNFSSILIKMDDYYIRGQAIANKDIPQALNLELIKQNLTDLQSGKTIQKPVYTFDLRKDYKELVKPQSVIILDGIFALSPKFIDKLDFTIFVSARESVRFARRLQRDMKERGCTKESIIKRWETTVQPGFIKYILPQKKKADIIINNN